MTFLILRGQRKLDKRVIILLHRKRCCNVCCICFIWQHSANTDFFLHSAGFFSFIYKRCIVHSFFLKRNWFRCVLFGAIFLLSFFIFVCDFYSERDIFRLKLLIWIIESQKSHSSYRVMHSSKNNSYEVQNDDENVIFCDFDFSNTLSKVGRLCVKTSFELEVG